MAKSISSPACICPRPSPTGQVGTDVDTSRVFLVQAHDRDVSPVFHPYRLLVGGLALGGLRPPVSHGILDPPALASADFGDCHRHGSSMPYPFRPNDSSSHTYPESVRSSLPPLQLTPSLSMGPPRLLPPAQPVVTPSSSPWRTYSALACIPTTSDFLDGPTQGLLQLRVKLEQRHPTSHNSPESQSRSPLITIYPPLQAARAHSCNTSPAQSRFIFNFIGPAFAS